MSVFLTHIIYVYYISLPLWTYSYPTNLNQGAILFKALGGGNCVFGHICFLGVFFHVIET